MNLNVESNGLICNPVDLEKSAIETCDDAILIRMFDAASKPSHEEGEMVNGIVNHSDTTNKTSSLTNTQPSNANSVRSKPKEWEVGERCMALFEEDKKYYPARILKIFQSEKSSEVVYMGYEDSPAIVELKHLLREEEVESAGGSADEKSATVVIGEEPEPIDQTAEQIPRTNNTTFPIPDLCPPPPPNLLAKVAEAANDKEALSNMLMSWYMAGYHSGYFQGLQKANKKEESQS